MQNSEKTPTQNRLEELTHKLAEILKQEMVSFADKVSEEMGSRFEAGILPYLRSTEDGGFKPDARVVILPVKEKEDESKTGDTEASGESEGEAVNPEPTDSPDTAR